MSTGTPQSLEDSIRLAIEAAEAANDVAAEISQMKGEYERAATRLERTRKNLVIIALGGFAAVATAVTFGALVYFQTLGDMKAANDTQLEALTMFSTSVQDLNGAVAEVDKIVMAYMENGDAQTMAAAQIDERMTAFETDMATQIEMLTDKAGQMQPQMASAIKTHMDEVAGGILEDVQLAMSDLQLAFSKMLATEMATMAKMIPEMTKTMAPAPAKPAATTPKPASTPSSTTSTPRRTTAPKPKPNPFSYP